MVGSFVTRSRSSPRARCCHHHASSWLWCSLGDWSSCLFLHQIYLLDLYPKFCLDLYIDICLMQPNYCIVSFVFFISFQLNWLPFHLKHGDRSVVMIRSRFCLVCFCICSRGLQTFDISCISIEQHSVYFLAGCKHLQASVVSFHFSFSSSSHSAWTNSREPAMVLGPQEAFADHVCWGRRKSRDFAIFRGDEESWENWTAGHSTAVLAPSVRPLSFFENEEPRVGPCSAQVKLVPCWCFVTGVTRLLGGQF